MQSIISLFMSSLFCVVFCYSTAAAQNYETDDDLCSELTVNGEIKISGKSGVRNQSGDYLCLFTPSSMRIDIFEIRLCETYPDATNYIEKCEILVKNSTGKLVDIANGVPTSLSDQPISIAEGTYKFVTVLVDPEIGGRYTLTFDSIMQGANGVGKTCWSNGKNSQPTYLDGHDTMSSDCGTASEANPVHSTTKFSSLYTPSGFSNASVGGAGTSMSAIDAYLMLDATTQMPASDIVWLNGNQEGGFGVVVDSTATMMLGVSQINPIVISPTTTNVDIGFSVENTFYAKTSTNQKYRTDGTFTSNGAVASICDNGQTEACMMAASPDRFIFQATAN